MPIYVMAPRSGIVKAGYEQSPTVVLSTDAPSPEALPAAVRSAADQVQCGRLSPFRRDEAVSAGDGVIFWINGDRLISGTTAGIRRDFYTPGRRSLVPVHLPCMPELDVDLIGIQPRWQAAGDPQDFLQKNLRIAANPQPSRPAVKALKENGEPWARLFLALLEEQQKPRAGIDRLRDLWQEGNLEPLIASLVLRNLIVLLIRQDSFDKADELLASGQKAYPEYAELSFLAAVSRIRQDKPSQAVPHLELAAKKSGAGFVGSGGENSYRANWLLGTISNFVGKQEMAVNYFFPALYLQPAFGPSVEALLSLRINPEKVYQLQWPLCELVRREPQYFQPVFQFFLLHRELAAAGRLLRTMALAPALRETCEQILAAAEAQNRPKSSPEETESAASTAFTASAAGVVIKGPFLVRSSLARINREMATAVLQAPDMDAGLEPHGFATLPPSAFSHGDLLETGLRRFPDSVDLTVRLFWPPDFRRPAAGRLASIIPWEYTAVPCKWVEQIEQNVDELWVPSDFVRDAFVGGGVNPERVRVIPLGFDPEVFQPEGETWRPEACRRFLFLFVGGLIARKGLDLLLEAYGEAFSADDDVTLVLKEIGSQSFYQHNSLHSLVHHFTHNRTAPHLLVYGEEFEEARLAELYRGADALALPYRGEGFGLPILEAMACGTPVVTTALGPAPEFCPPGTAYLIPAKSVPIPDAPPPLGEFSAEFTWFEPDVGELARTLRHIYENRPEAAQRGAAAASQVRRTHAWSCIQELYLERIRHLVRGGRSETASDLSLATAR